MRHFYLAAAAGALMLGFPAVPAFAQGGVLVPNDTPPAASTGNFGMPQSTPNSEILLPQLDPNEGELPSSAPSMSQMPPSVALSHDPTKETKVLKMAATEAPDNPGDEDLPENIRINLKDYMWGPKDVDTINKAFHIPGEQVPKACRLSLTGSLQSDSEQAYYPFDMGATLSEVTVFYDGKPSGIDIIARAMCDAVPLPPNSGLIIQVGDKYTTYIAHAQCPPPPPNVQTLTLKYAGNGKTDCVYQ